MSKKVKNRSQMASFMFLPVLDYFSEISSPKATKSRAVGPFTTNDVFVYRNIHRKRSKKVTKLRAVCPFNMIDGPKARVPASTV